MRQRVTAEQIRLAKSVDLISYIKQYELQEQVRTITKNLTHNSFCINDNRM